MVYTFTEMKECGQQKIFLVDHHLPNNKNLIMNHNFAKSAMKTSINNRGCSSVGRASGLHPEGRRFDSYQLHHLTDGYIFCYTTSVIKE